MNAPRHRCRLAVLAEYYQFYVQDPEAQHAQDWTNEDVIARVKTMPGVVMISPVRDTEVPVEVGIWDSEPQVIFNAWQHVIEAPLVTAGRIEVQGCLDDSKACFSVEPGDYTVRVLYRGLDTVSEDGLDGKDFYQIQIWKQPCPTLRVIRRWE